jgi:hypothetical protein
MNTKILSVKIKSIMREHKYLLHELKFNDLFCESAIPVADE